MVKGERFTLRHIQTWLFTCNGCGLRERVKLVDCHLSEIHIPMGWRERYDNEHFCDDCLQKEAEATARPSS